jgi:toluene monooxygenase system protein E
MSSSVWRRQRRPSKLKTYAHLGRERRMPSDYELVTSELLYYPRRGFEVTTPLQAWYAEHQTGSRLSCRDWERFADPRETTYFTYTALASTRETYVDGILESIEKGGYDAALSSEWRAVLDRVLGPLRFPLHGFQMIAAYIGQMAPSGRITAAAAFQTADELRRIQRIAYRMVQLSFVEPGFGARSRSMWEKDRAWQPLRQAVERCLVTYDWAEALVALNLCLKPLVDALFMVELPKLAQTRGDSLLGPLFSSFDEDCRWHRNWTKALFKTAIADAVENRAVLAKWVEKWAPLSLAAVDAFDFLDLGDGSRKALVRSWSALLHDLDLEAPSP